MPRLCGEKGFLPKKENAGKLTSIRDKKQLYALGGVLSSA
jgi:hypothetical protein